MGGKLVQFHGVIQIIKNNVYADIKFVEY